MHEANFDSPTTTTSTTAAWQSLLSDQAALFRNPGAHHKALLTQAYELHRSDVINRDELSDLLEQADGALAYAVEELFDPHSDE